MFLMLDTRIYSPLKQASFDWRYETLADIAFDVPPNVKILYTRIVGGNDATQLTAANQGTDATNYILFSDAQYADYVFGADIPSVDNYLVVTVNRNNISNRTRHVIEVLTDVSTAKIPVMSTFDTDFAVDTLRFHNTYNLAGFTDGQYSVYFAGLLDGQQFYGAKGLTGGGDGEINYGTTSLSVTNMSGIRIGHDSIGRPYTHSTAAALVIGGINAASISDAVDEYYDWGVAQGLIV